jgi:SAM-dependent methyltransferase
VNSTTSAQLVDLNKQFYQTFAGEFAATRRRLQPGVRRILDGLPLDAPPAAHLQRLLDLGCGSGELAGELARRGFCGFYTGLDFSPRLLAEARQNLDPANPASGRIAFLTADLSRGDWPALLGDQRYHTILAFAVLHHLPGEALRRQVLSAIKNLFLPGARGEGRFIFSVWQFMRSPRLAGRVVPWERAGLSPGQVDPGDYLLDWRAGGLGLRYVHLFSEEELHALAAACGFQVTGQGFYSDGKEGNLSLYQVWAP